MRTTENVKSLGAVHLRLRLGYDSHTLQGSRERRGEHGWAEERRRYVAELGLRVCGSGGSGGLLHGDVVEEPAGVCVWCWMRTSEDLQGGGGACFCFEREGARVDVSAETAGG